MVLRQYQIVGRRQPTESNPHPQIYRMRVFAKNEVVAKSRFWYFLHQYSKMKKSTGEILAVNEIRERNRRIVNNYGITLRYNSRSGTHNMYKEFRDVTLNDAVQMLYMDMAGRHRARFSSIQIRDTKIVPAGVRAIKRSGDANGCSSENVKQFLKSSIKFPLPHRVPRATSRANNSVYKAAAPTTFFS
jgi:large subunit ribosomal protein L18Ae